MIAAPIPCAAIVSKAAGISSGLEALTMRSSALTLPLAASICSMSRTWNGSAALTSAPIRVAVGIASRKRPRILPAISATAPETPVILPPGRARVATSFDPTGSATPPITIGILSGAAFAASAAGVVTATMTSTFAGDEVRRHPGQSRARPAGLANLELDIALCVAHAPQRLAQQAQGRFRIGVEQHADDGPARRLRARGAATRPPRLPPPHSDHLVGLGEECHRHGEAEGL